MSGWRSTHQVRLDAISHTVESRLAEVNEMMLHLPPKYRITVNEDGRCVSLVGPNEKETENDGL